MSNIKNKAEVLKAVFEEIYRKVIKYYRSRGFPERPIHYNDIYDYIEGQLSIGDGPDLTFMDERDIDGYDEDILFLIVLICQIIPLNTEVDLDFINRLDGGLLDELSEKFRDFHKKSREELHALVEGFQKKMDASLISDIPTTAKSAILKFDKK